MIILGVLAYKIKRKKIKLQNLLIIILRIILPFFSYFFFGQILTFLLSTIYCIKEVTIESEYLQCLTGIWIYFRIFAIIAIIFHIIISYITIKLYYKPIFNINDKDILKKTNSYPDVLFMFTKIVIILMLKPSKGSEIAQWNKIFFSIIVLGANTYYTITNHNRKNKALKLLNNIMSLITFIGYVTLFIGKIFKYFFFDGLLYLFIIDIILFCIYIYYYKKGEFNFINNNYKYISNSYEYLNYVFNFFFDC